MTPKTILHFAIGPIGAALLGFVSLPLTAWLFTQEDIGRIAMLTVTVQFVTLVFSLGLDQAYIREYHHYDDHNKLFKQCITPGLTFLSFTLLILLLINPTLLSDLLFEEESLYLSLIVATCLLGAFISRFTTLIFRVQEKGLAFSLSNIAPKFLIILCLAGIWLFGLPSQFSLLLSSQGIAIVATTVVFVFMARATIAASWQATISADSIKSLLSYGLPLVMGNLAYWGLAATDKLFLKELSNFSELGLYAVATSFAMAATLLKSIFSTLWAPTVYKWAKDEKQLEKIAPINQLVLFAVVILAGLTGTFSFLVDFILPSTYSGLHYLVPLCMVAPLLYTLSETTVIGINLTRKTHYSMAASVLAFIANCLGNFFLIPLYGATGAATSTALAFFIFLVLRTEFSIFSWQSMPRLQMYLLTSFIIVSAGLTAIAGQDIGWKVHALWGMGTILFVLIKFSAIKLHLNTVLKKR